MSYSYQQVKPASVGLLKALLEVFAGAFGEPHTHLDAIPSENYLRALLGKEYFIALVALAGDEVVGGLTAYELKKFEQERSEIYIYDLAVREDHRRKGVATGLIEKLKSIARQRRAWVIFVQADIGDVGAVKLYESLGKREEVYHFDIPISE